MKRIYLSKEELAKIYPKGKDDSMPPAKEKKIQMLFPRSVRRQRARLLGQEFKPIGHYAGGCVTERWIEGIPVGARVDMADVLDLTFDVRPRVFKCTEDKMEFVFSQLDQLDAEWAPLAKDKA